MDYAQQCYNSYWRLFSDPSIGVHGGYYFNDNAPVYPYAHVYWHRQWQNQNWPSDVIPGPDLSAAVEYTNGQWPFAFPFAKIVGRQECITHGDGGAGLTFAQLNNGLPFD